MVVVGIIREACLDCGAGVGSGHDALASIVKLTLLIQKHVRIKTLTGRSDNSIQLIFEFSVRNFGGWAHHVLEAEKKDTIRGRKRRHRKGGDSE